MNQHKRRKQDWVKREDTLLEYRVGDVDLIPEQMRLRQKYRERKVSRIASTNSKFTNRETQTPKRRE